jgi:5-methylcytosine-specific restriction endonuclease McrA
VFPKPPPRSKEKRDRRREQRQQRTALRRGVWYRDNRCCRRCGDLVGIREAHIHEIVFRSQGGDPLDPKNCLTLCPRCHLIHVHGQGATVAESIRCLTEARANGPVVFEAKETV